ncbi:MAG: hypothetical protein IJV56_02925, partial [Neisseriaceae bacterium]|nr:hypothetical protein [Neisseriaceae bacterium]
AERELFEISRKNNEELQAACGVYGSLETCNAKQAEAAAGIEYSKSQYPSLSKFDDSFYAAQAQGYKINALQKLDKIAEQVQASNGLQAMNYLGELNQLAQEPDFIQQYKTNKVVRDEFDGQIAQLTTIIQNENRATESLFFDKKLPIDNIAKLNGSVLLGEKPLENVYPELWLVGTGGLAKSGLVKLGETTLAKRLVGNDTVVIAGQSYKIPFSTLNPTKVTVYRVEGSNTRILLDDVGNVQIIGDKTLFLNFGSRDRAIEFLSKRQSQGFIDTTVKSFNTNKSVLKDLRKNAVAESEAKKDLTKNIVVDTNKAKDQYGIRSNYFDTLNNNIVKGSGKNAK